VSTTASKPLGSLPTPPTPAAARRSGPIGQLGRYLVDAAAEPELVPDAPTAS
jgi:hypothetical protein